ncbi:8593_t:CDS:1 [Scutellospora calospora]|uniref:8593_t:CDS:1 n=1 Tax=Scutellospora calospora TaxID=85575 RepID=A0ACA9K252_9GLOM|nr:8593_t:CDS:1 [Scutellospora calospora]
MNTNTLETDHLLQEGEDGLEKSYNFRDHMEKFLKARQTHWIVLCLVLADFLCVMTTVVITVLWPDINEEEHFLIEVLSLIAFIINCLFIIEIGMHIFIFGLGYFFKGSNWFIHLFDAIIVIATFFLEILLKGKQREVAGLLIIFRLWRLIKILSAVAVGIEEYVDEQAENLKRKAESLEKELNRVLNEVSKIALEDMWSENRRARVFRKFAVDGSRDVPIDVIHE